MLYYPIKANTNNSCGSNGKSVVKSVAKTAVTVSAFWNHTANNPIIDTHTQTQKRINENVEHWQFVLRKTERSLDTYETPLLRKQLQRILANSCAQQSRSLLLRYWIAHLFWKRSFIHWSYHFRFDSNRSERYLPPTGAAKHEPTPTAQAAANISQWRDSFS